MRDVLYDGAERRDDAALICDWCHEPSDTDICASCQQHYASTAEPAAASQAVRARPTTQSLVDVVRAVTRQKKLGRV